MLKRSDFFCLGLVAWKWENGKWEMGNRKDGRFFCWLADTKLSYMCWSSWAMNRNVGVMPAWRAVFREAIVTVVCGVKGGL